MIPAELQLRDEALTAAGHDPECAAYDDRDCSCGVAELASSARSGNAGEEPVGRSRHRLLSSTPAQNVGLQLTGAAASTHTRMVAAGKRTRELQEELQRSEAEFRAALAEHLEACTR